MQQSIKCNKSYAYFLKYFSIKNKFDEYAIKVLK